MPKEAMEIPNTDLKAIKSEAYTQVVDGAGATVAVVPQSWSLFDLELWGSGYAIGHDQGQRAGIKTGRRQYRDDLQAMIFTDKCGEKRGRNEL